jgi:hypothetical protein
MGNKPWWFGTGLKSRSSRILEGKLHSAAQEISVTLMEEPEKFDDFDELSLLELAELAHEFLDGKLRLAQEDCDKLAQAITKRHHQVYDLEKLRWRQS